MLLISDLSFDSVAALLGRYGLSVELIPNEQTINGSYWGEPEAGLMGDRVFVRSNTPVHSVLHETCHIVCMSPQRRLSFAGPAGNSKCGTWMTGDTVFALEAPRAGLTKTPKTLDYGSELKDCFSRTIAPPSKCDDRDSLALRAIRVQITLPRWRYCDISCISSALPSLPGS